MCFSWPSQSGRAVFKKAGTSWKFWSSPKSIHSQGFFRLPAWSMVHPQASLLDNETRCCDRKHRLVQNDFQLRKLAALLEL